MVDIHTHILPFIDDGASSYEESLEMLRVMVSKGVSKVVATPHFDFETDNLENFIEKRNEIYNELLKKTRDEQIEVEILLGCELMFTSGLSSIDLSPFAINDTDYVLIELSTRYESPNLEETINSILSNGFIPILAHVERYSYLIRNSQRLVNLIEMGVLMQVNYKSIEEVRKYPFVNAMIKNNLIHLTGSDAHNFKKRSCFIKTDLMSEEMKKNANLIIRNKVVEVKKARKITKILNRFF